MHHKPIRYLQPFFNLKHLTTSPQAACYNPTSNDAFDSQRALSVASILWVFSVIDLADCERAKHSQQRP